LGVFFRNPLEQWGISRTWAHNIRSHAVACDFARESLIKRDNSALARRVDSFARRTYAPSIGANRNNCPVALLDHLRTHRMEAIQRTVQINIDDAFPDIYIQFEEGSDPVPTSVIY